MKDFFSGGRALPWWLSGVSFYMASFSAFAFVTYSDMAYYNGLPAFFIYWCHIPAALISTFIFAARWRRASTTSPLEYIKERYGDVMRQCLAWIGLPLRVIDNSTRLFSIAVLVTGSLGLVFGKDWGIFKPGTEMYWMVILSGIIILVYSFMGGLWAIVVTDFVQFLVMLTAVIVLLILSLKAVVAHGGMAAFTAQVSQQDPNFFHLLNVTPQQTIDAKYMISWLVIISLSLSSNWALVQRYYSVKTDNEARKVGMLMLTLMAVTPLLLFLPALMARLYMPGIVGKNIVYAQICKGLLPAGMIGMLISAMFSATMSTLAGDFNAMSAVITSDIYRPLRPKASQREYLLAGRLFTVVVGVIIIGMTLYIVYLFNHKIKLTLFDLMTRLFATFLPPIAIPMFVGLWNRRFNNTSGMFGLILGIASGFTCFLISTNANWFGVDSEAIAKAYAAVEKAAPVLTAKEFWIYNLGQTWLVLTITIVVTIAGMLIGNSISTDSPERREKIEGLFRRLEEPESAVIAEREKKLKSVEFTPFPIIGIVFGTLGALFILFVRIATPGAPAIDKTIGTVTGILMMIVAVGIYCLKYVVRSRSMRSE
ncbi:hypothetical protein LLG95_00360 [bacterium]|nr:hypothetical protein [bacterium]